MASSFRLLAILMLLAGCFLSSNDAINHWVATKEGTIQAHVSTEDETQ